MTNRSRLPIDSAGLPFLGVALAVSAAAWFLAGWAAGAALLVVAAFLAFFFRDPEREVRATADAVLSPADGRVMVAGAAQPGAAPEGHWKQISIFLSPLDVHVNRIPASGRITSVRYTPGRFLPAYRPDAAVANERCEIWIDHGGRTVVARQVVGVLARRVVCRVQSGQSVQAGDRYGIMKFGSRMDVFLPPNADVRVNVGDRVRGGETLIAVLH